MKKVLPIILVIIVGAAVIITVNVEFFTKHFAQGADTKVHRFLNNDKHWSWTYDKHRNITLRSEEFEITFPSGFTMQMADGLGNRVRLQIPANKYFTTLIGTRSEYSLDIYPPDETCAATIVSDDPVSQPRGTLTVRGLTFTKTYRADVAAGSFYQNYQYRGIQDGRCYQLVFNLRTVNDPMVYGDVETREESEALVEEHRYELAQFMTFVEGIIKNVVIRP
jgi:hypothetical protein